MSVTRRRSSSGRMGSRSRNNRKGYNNDRNNNNNNNNNNSNTNSDSDSECDEERDVDRVKIRGYSRLVVKMHDILIKFESVVEEVKARNSPATEDQVRRYREYGEELKRISRQANRIWNNDITECEEKLSINLAMEHTLYEEILERGEEAMEAWKEAKRRHRAGATAHAGGGSSRKRSRSSQRKA